MKSYIGIKRPTVWLIAFYAGLWHLENQQQAVLADAPDAADLSDRPLYSLTESEVDAQLGAMAKAYSNLTDHVVAFGRRNIGQPYEIYLLGEYPFEFHDPDPIYCLTQSDCVTFCEHTYAMALSPDWWTFLQTLQRIRYRDGVVGMLTRNHYTVADWDRNNRFLFEDMTDQLGQGRVAVPLRQVCRRSRFFAKFGIGNDVPDEPIEDSYIPKGRVEGILGELRAGDFVNIIRGDQTNQWVGHTGLIAIADDGTVDFLHSARPVVREQALLDYLSKDRRCVGIKILRLRPNAERIMGQALASSTKATPVNRASLEKALARHRASTPRTAIPPILDWQQAMRLQAYRLTENKPVDAPLQQALTDIDRKLGEKYGIDAAQRAIGVLDLTDLRLAWIQPDKMFYAASLPKICILLAYFATNPEAAKNLPDDVALELGRMIKVSDNEFAAKYGRRVGVENVQEILQSKRYQLYDTKNKTGFWYGKHYSPGEPRLGDPVHDHSHGATVRQTLRYYLMMEQGRLVDHAASTRMRQIFAAPLLEHLQSKFVAGLKGRDLNLIRKSGTWQDWHVDSARIEHDGRVYLLAGMVHHRQGGAYLADVAAAVDELLCGLGGQEKEQYQKPYSHQTIIHESTADFERGNTRHVQATRDKTEGVWLRPIIRKHDYGVARRAPVYESEVVDSDMFFNELLLSWNIDTPPGSGFRVEARVGRRSDGSWSPYLFFGDWGDKPPGGDKVTKWEQGLIDVDYLTSDHRFDRAQYRVTASPNGPDRSKGDRWVRVVRMSLCFSDTTGKVNAVPARRNPPRITATSWQRRLEVPFISQRDQRADLAGRICSPTSVSMVMGYRGVDRSPEDVARAAYDSAHDIYGNWPRAVQTAFVFGIPGYLTRFSDWADVERMIAQDQPLIISITVQKGQLSSASDRSTAGHLLVLTGFDERGQVTVNDPAARSADAGQTTHPREDLETVWMRAKAGTAYVLLPQNARAEVVPGTVNNDEGLVEVTSIDRRILIDLRYATANNFTGQPLYAVARCLLRESVAKRLSRVQDRLTNKGLGLKIYDGYRPLSVQRIMWKLVPDPKYVADPAKGSRHNRGAAVDVTLVDAQGRELEMPTEYDDFTPAAARNYAGGTEAARRHRRILTQAMEAEGFTGLDSEWWHFDAPGWSDYPILDVPLASVP